MTKSRTLRKAGAVVLSLAMALSVTAFGPDASAAAKPKLSSKKATFAAGKTKKVTIKNLKKSQVKSISVKSSNKKVATVKKNGKTGFKVTGADNLTAKKTATITVTVKLKKAINGKKKYTFKYKATVKAGATKDQDDTKVILDKITISSKNALQSDGTVLKGDTLKADIAADLGVFQDLVWTCNGKSKNTSGSYGTAKLEAPTDEAGEWQLKAVTSKGTTYLSNKLTVTDKVAPVQIENFEIVEPYDDLNKDDVTGDAIVYLEKTPNLVAHFTVNRLYENSEFGICEADKATKAFSGAKDTYKFTAKSTVNAEATAATVVGKDTIVSTAAIGNKAEVFIALDDVQCTRGTSYVGMIDQDKITTDTPGKGAENMSAPAAAPYVVAPTALVVTSFESNTTAKLELRDADGKALAWLQSPKSSAAAKITVKTMNKKDNAIATTDSLTDSSASSPIAKGVVKSTGKFGERYFYATATLAAKIWGKDEVTLTSNIIEKAADPATKMELAEDTTTPTTANVKFENLATRASGTVYVWQSTATAAEAVEMDIPKNAASATVAGGSAKVDVASVFTKDNVGVTNKKEYVAVFVPDSVGEFTKKAATFNLESTFAKFKAATVYVDDTTSGAIVGVDQFGNDITAGAAVYTKYVTDKMKGNPTITLTAAGGSTAVIKMDDGTTPGTAGVGRFVVDSVTYKGEYTYTLGTQKITLTVKDVTTKESELKFA